MSGSSERSVLITGASSGIGAAAADLLARSGFRVAGTSRDPELAAQRAPQIEWVAMDVRDDASVVEGVKRAIDRIGALDALVCNAGIGVFGSVEEVPLSRRARTVRDELVRDAARAARRAARAAPQRDPRASRSWARSRAARRFRSRRIIRRAKQRSTRSPWRSTTKLFGTGVRVSLIEPGDIRTGFNDATDFDLVRDSSYGDRVARCREVIERSLANVLRDPRSSRA